MESKSSVREFYKGKNVLVTGPSGFMGKVLVEKLLYTIPDIGRVYLVLRPKWGKTVQERLEHMLSSPMFERLRKEQKGAFEKMIPIQGDVLKDDLGISNEDMKILSEEVSIVFHMAAILKMEAPLKDSVAMNTAGTQRALDVARRFKHLVMFVHVSTAFCYPEYKVLEEKFHDPPVNPSDIMRMCEWLDDKQVSLLTPSLLGQHPNTYTYTKRLAESLVYDAHPEIPCVIARPSIVCPAYADPIPGWVDNLNGPVGLIIGAGKGVIRTMLCDPSIYAQVIPVDGAINAIIALVMIEAAKKSENIPIYNLNVGHKKPTTWGEVLKCAKEYTWKYPVSFPLWYPNGDITTNVVAHEIKRVLFHLVPAYIIDFFLLIFRQKRFMVRVQDKISRGLELLQYFTVREWHFPCPNFEAIHNTLSEEERLVYITHKDPKEFDMWDYFHKGVETGRVICLKDDLSKIPLNRIYFKFLYVLDSVVKIVFWCFVLSFIVSWCQPLRDFLAFGEPIVRRVPFVGSAVFHK
ncbi:putative fatty acyl-CoA reductase CG5065 isoform X2 [Leguminivora glycinivorella]|nr:putative fatty acyl-CoA reductase CG5065 isoform X2 [Leguminivora glycinivorella]XP_048004872.1 putative fatty acyl-CoA reductase CG5065 isoform X2 [Leguminivora glycinivorella]XP_048004881.1 putative fatty acyl-CoA reductase CG5065 isoform X2 [Leguminivora glycinivorella]XP_048004891.1 putative fatty acyl-CoA reductase CG5065 isoform X2 [Leguminivora glycinivorella]XP_048004899.1 putative fatty acyl-CoA reductase CG5065 isoform X2 [Leguminivora glycinivorella]